LEWANAETPQQVAMIYTTLGIAQQKLLEETT
jgi:hypothetical protein